nr:MAG TPA: hypothetical protein [Caudoviricetes sp.]
MILLLHILQQDAEDYRSLKYSFSFQIHYLQRSQLYIYLLY